GRRRCSVRGRPLARRIERLCEAHLADGRSYEVCFVPGLLENGEVWRSLLGHRRGLLVAPTEVWRQYGARIEALRQQLRLDLHVLALDLDEAGKNLDTVAAICAACQQHGLGRTD